MSYPRGPKPFPEKGPGPEGKALRPSFSLRRNRGPDAEHPPPYCALPDPPPPESTKVKLLAEKDKTPMGSWGVPGEIGTCSNL